MKKCCSRRKLVACLSVVTTVIFLLNVSLKAKNTHLPKESAVLGRYLILTNTCRIPDLEALPHRYQDGITVPTCHAGSSSPLTYIKSNWIIVNRTAEMELLGEDGQVDCCFRDVLRDNEGRSDDTFRYSSKCTPLVNGRAKLSSPFVRVTCTDGERSLYSEFHAAILKSKSVEERCLLLKKRNAHRQRAAHRPLSVLLFGVDTMSRLNFLRFMPRTRSIFEASSHEVAEMLGYNKLRDNTFPNLVPVLTGLLDSQLRQACWKGHNSSFDDCQFLWHQFLNKGYRTLFAEDSPHLATFNYFRKGFMWPPTDYYLRPLMLAAMDRSSRKVDFCVGSKLEMQVVLDWLFDFVHTFAENEYFAITWLNSLIHNAPQNAQVADKFLSSFFATLFGRGMLNNTVLIFFSDHGPRWGSARNTLTGWYEEKLPMLFILLPSWMRTVYPRLVDTLHENSKRLVTPFDIHQTLMDILELPAVAKGKLVPSMYPDFPQQGTSLFRSISENRTCTDVQIEQHFCACNEPTQVSVYLEEIKDIAEFVVSFINGQLHASTNKCEEVKLVEIQSAQKLNMKHGGATMYVVTLSVWPNDVILEATVSTRGKIKRIEGEVSRITAYDGQANCITDVILRKYCYCIK